MLEETALRADLGAEKFNDQEAETSEAVIVYNSENGNLFYNPNGSETGFDNGGQFATLTNLPELEGEDFFLRG